MDPVFNIEQQRKLAKYILAEIERISDDGGNTPDEFWHDGTVDSILTDAEQLASLVQMLDHWRLGGGFDPYTANPAQPEAL
jgi:hypothetical protein